MMFVWLFVLPWTSLGTNNNELQAKASTVKLKAISHVFPRRPGNEMRSEEEKDFPTPLYKWGFDHRGVEQASSLTAERKTYKQES